MSRERKGVRDIPEEMYRQSERIHEVNMGTYNRRGMHIFGANVQLARAIPNITDGFKPSARRCLYAACKIAHADKKMKKVNAIVGAIIQIHPHGDTSIAQTLVSLSKPWELTYPLITIDGNNGTPKGEPAAAGRYLEAQLSPYAMDCYFKEWDEQLVDMLPSYNPEYDEPIGLPSRFPDLLLRPSTGFTFGIVSNTPSYNLEEAFNAVINLIKDPFYDPVLIPDMPCDCIILDEGKFPSICRRGAGSFNMRAEIETDEERNTLIIEAIPYKVKLDDVKLKLSKLRTEVFASLVNMFDGSNKYGVHLELEFAPGTDLASMKALLYKKTSLQSSFAVQMNYVDMQQGEVIQYNLKEVMQNWISERRIVKRKSMQNRLVMDVNRLHILNILIDICEDELLLNQIITLIRKSDKDRIIELLHTNRKFKDRISSVQAKGICNMRISELSHSSHMEYKRIRKEVEAEICDLNDVINNPKKIDKMIIKELEDAIEKYNQPRRCRVVKYDQEMERLNLISENDYRLVFTKNGFVKKLTANATSVGELNPSDEPVMVTTVNNRDLIMLFDSAGMLHMLHVSDVMECDKTSRGITLSTYVRAMGPIVSIIPYKVVKQKSFFIFLTKNGMMKKTPCDMFTFKSSVIAIRLRDKDAVVSVTHSKEDMDVLVFTRHGFGTRFNTNTLSPTSRTAIGVIGIDLADGDSVTGLNCVQSDDTDIMVITRRGLAKICSLSTVPLVARRGDVLILSGLSRGDYLLNVIPCKPKDSFLVLMKGRSLLLGYDDFAQLTRNHIGKKVIPVPRGEKIIRCMKNSK